MTLTKAADLTEVKYLLSVIRKRDLPLEEIQVLFNRGVLTLMC